MLPEKLIVGTRGSPLALRQTEIVQERLSALGIKTELCKVKTSGDIFLDKPLHQLNGFGVFVAEIDERMLCGEIDLAVHSMKDLPSKRPKELTISAILKRDSPYDVLLCRTDSARGLDGLRGGNSWNIKHEANGPATSGQARSEYIEPARKSADKAW